ncbi:hypothetical protein AOG1_22940 [Geobacter sp. AOG1]|nr:hypothetical protein AOG1_22940 [Geobacter sp. AOG1]
MTGNVVTCEYSHEGNYFEKHPGFLHISHTATRDARMLFFVIMTSTHKSMSISINQQVPE